MVILLFKWINKTACCCYFKLFFKGSSISDSNSVRWWQFKVVVTTFYLLMPFCNMNSASFLCCYIWVDTNTAISASLCTLIPPQEWLDRKSTGDVTPGWTGYLRRKSSSAGFISLFISRIWGHNKQEGLWNVVFSAQTTFPFHLIRSKQGCWSQEQVIQWQACTPNKPCRRWNRLPFLPGRRAERCTWACHTQIVLWWCTGRRRRWCCQLGWTPAASESRPARTSGLLSGKPRWTPGDTPERLQLSRLTQDK